MGKIIQDAVLILVNRDKCGICGCCVPVCPVDSLVLHDAYLAVDRETCTGCMKCLPVCPTDALYAGSVDGVFPHRGG